MQPTFILTRAFAISALMVGAAPLAQAAPIYTTTSCASGTSCTSSSLSSLWGFLAAFMPKASSSGLGFAGAYPEDAFHFVTAKPETSAANREAIVVVVLTEETCVDGSCGDGLYKRDDAEIASHEPERVEERTEATEHNPEDLDIIIREPTELENRDAEPDPMCFNIAFCKRERESEK